MMLVKNTLKIVSMLCEITVPFIYSSSYKFLTTTLLYSVLIVLPGYRNFQDSYLNKELQKYRI